MDYGSAFAPPRSIGPSPYPLWPFGPSPLTGGVGPRAPITGISGAHRRRGFRIPRFVLSDKARSLHRSSSPTQTRFAGLCVGGRLRRPIGWKIGTSAGLFLRLALPSRWRLVRIPAGGPRASPTQSRTIFLSAVGDGLAPPAKAPFVKGGPRSGGGIPSPREHSRCASFFSVEAHSVRPRASLGPAPTAFTGQISAFS